MLRAKVKTVDGSEDVEAYTVTEFNPPEINFESLRRGRKSYLFSADFAVFDSETSHIGEVDGWIYQWAVKFCGYYIIGRKPSEFITLLKKLSEEYDLSEYKKIIIYIHNAQYDLQYLKKFLMEYDPNIHILATDTHSILICDVWGFRILCSYKLSNMSLDLFSKTYAKKYIKASGAIDYTKVRYQDSPLDEVDWYYMLSDVASQKDAIDGYLLSMGYDRAYKAPFTSTGFVRNACRKTALKEKGWRDKFKSMAFTLEQYKVARSAFMGGITISSYKYNGITVGYDCSIGHVDFTSSYPARQMMDYFPDGKPMWYGEVETREELEELCSKYCCIFILTLYNVKIKQGVTAPYIPYSKCIMPKEILKVNGKVVLAEQLSIAITEIDYNWIVRQYDFEDMSVSKMMIMDRGEAPEFLKTMVMENFKNKCRLKHGNPDETEEETENRTKRYNASKALLNGIYGMSATAIIREQYELNNDGIIEKQNEIDEETQLNKFYNSYNSFMPYQLGIWTTAHARNALMTLIETIGYSKFLYCDTDSVFYIKDEETERKIEEYNKAIQERAIKNNAYIDNNYLGLATYEPDIKRFRSLHAKCYACEEKNDKSGEYELHVTIAGVPKKSIHWENGTPVEYTNSQELGDIDNLEDGFVFRKCGGTRCVYAERPITRAEIKGHPTEYASSAVILNIEKEISDTMYTVGADYELLHISQSQSL